MRSTLQLGRATLVALVYMILQPIRCTAVYITIGSVSSYLTFSPLPCMRQGGHSLLHYSTLADSFPLGSMVLCVARTFLTFSGEKARQIAPLLACSLFVYLYSCRRG